MSYTTTYAYVECIRCLLHVKFISENEWNWEKEAQKMGWFIDSDKQMHLCPEHNNKANFIKDLLDGIE